MPSAPEKFATVTGTLKARVVPSPSWPAPLPPQHQTVSSARRAQVWWSPARTATASNRIFTGRAGGRGTTPPSPSSPALFQPQHQPVPSIQLALAVGAPAPDGAIAGARAGGDRARRHLGRRGRQRDHDRAGAAQAGAVAQLPVAVLAPAADDAGAIDGASVGLARRDGGDAAQVGHRGGRRVRRPRTAAQLT